MSGNNIRQAVTSATSSVITLGAALDNLNIIGSQFADGRNVAYVVFEGNDWQLCTGIYTASGTTLAIDRILQKSVSGTVEDLPATGLTLTSAAIVKVTPAAQYVNEIFVDSVLSTGSFIPHNLGYNSTTGSPGGEFTATANRLVLTTAWFYCPVKITDVGVNITTVSAGNNCRVGFYHRNYEYRRA